MTRVGTRLLAALVAAALAALLLTACGSSDSSNSTNSASSGSTTTQSQSEAEAKLKERVEEARRKQEAEGKGSAQKQGGEGGSQGSGGSPPKNVSTPLKVSGGGSDQFRTKGGDNSIQNYGEEGGESELEEVAETVHDFYVARAEEKWEKACSYLAKSNVEQLEQLASQSPQFKGKGCGPILQAFTRPLPAAVQREITTVDAGSFRHDGEQGFLIYYGAEHTTYAIPLRNEDGVWQVAALSGSAIGAVG